MIKYRDKLCLLCGSLWFIFFFYHGEHRGYTEYRRDFSFIAASLKLQAASCCQLPTFFFAFFVPSLWLSVVEFLLFYHKGHGGHAENRREFLAASCTLFNAHCDPGEIFSFVEFHGASCSLLPASNSS
jgi:hypothetical protein